MKQTTTISFPTGEYVLIPVDPSNESCDVLKQHADGYLSNIGAYRAMLAAVPDQLPGVREHDGEPCAFVNGDELLSMNCGNPAPVALSAHRSGWTKTALFSHPAPSQPSAKHKRMPEIVWPEGYCTDPNGAIIAPAGKNVDFNFGYEIGFDEGFAIIDSARHEAERRRAEALVQAALEAAAAIHDGEAAAQGFSPMSSANWHKHYSHAIRALSAQQIIESCKEKS